MAEARQVGGLGTFRQELVDGRIVAIDRPHAEQIVERRDDGYARIELHRQPQQATSAPAPAHEILHAAPIGSLGYAASAKPP